MNNNLKIRHQLLLVLILFLFSGIANGQKSTEEKYGIKYIQDKRIFQYNIDGTRKTTVEQELFIGNDYAVNKYKLISLDFNQQRECYDKIVVEVVNDTGSYVVDSKNYLSKDIQDGVDKFSTEKRILIPVSNLKPGSRLKINYVLNEFIPAFPGFMFDSIYLNPDYDCDALNYTVIYPINAQIDFHDEDNDYKAYAVSKSENGFVTLTIKKENVLGSIMSEQHQATSFARENVIYLSSFKNIEEAGKTEFAYYQPELDKPTPPKLLQIFGPKPSSPLGQDQALQALKDGIKRIFYNFHYFGDTREANSGRAPRSLEQIVDVGYGGCKEFSVILYHLAKYLGLSADIVLIHSETTVPYVPLIPMIKVNHAIVRIKIPDTERYWYVDSTTGVPFVDITHKDLAGRKAFVIGPSVPTTIEIPEYTPEDSIVERTESIDLSRFPLKVADVTIKYAGYIGLYVQSETKQMIGWQREQYFLSEYDSDASSATVEGFLLKEDEVKPYTVSTEMKVLVDDQLMRAGNYKVIDTDYQTGGTYAKIIAVSIKNRRSDLSLGYPRSGKSTVNFKPGTYKRLLGNPQSCTIKSPWFEFDRQIATDPFTQIDNYRILKRVITVDEIKTSEFRKLRDGLLNCLNGVRVVYE